MAKRIKTKPTTTKSRRGGYVEGTVETCAHRVTYRYWDFMAEITDELKEWLEEAAEERAKKLIIEGYHSGELNYALDIGDQTEEIRGWWEIDRS